MNLTTETFEEKFPRSGIFGKRTAHALVNPTLTKDCVSVRTPQIVSDRKQSKRLDQFKCTYQYQKHSEAGPPT